MALVNFTVPFAPVTTAPAYFGNYAPPAAVNSLLYSSHTREPYQPPASPSRRSSTASLPHQYSPSIPERDLPDNKRAPRYYSRESYHQSANLEKHGSHHLEPGQQPRYPPPSRPPGFTRIEAGNYGPSAKTSLHAVVDYDDDLEDYSYEDDEDPVDSGFHGTAAPPVTPIQGPILIKNGSVPVVPLYSYPVINNGTFVQIPILWTALSLALGLEIRGEIIRGVPCIKRFHQLFCPTAGNSYPIESIERFIDENKALMKRMYGEFQMSTEYGPPNRDQIKRNVKRDAAETIAAETGADGGPRHPYLLEDVDAPSENSNSKSHSEESYFNRLRQTRQTFRNNQSSESGRIDACESKVEIVTPYWASNSAGKVRAIVNTQHFEQAIHQEVCSTKLQTKRCSGECGCEQKYKWHRLLAYDPENDCKGIFMDWFLFPSCCVCRCNPTFGNK